jgi:hypothetical protein
MLRKLGHVFGLVLGYAAMSISLRLSDAIVAQQAAAAEVPAA